MDNKALLKKTAYTYGLYLGILSTLFAIIMYAMGMYDISGQGSTRWVSSLVSFALTVGVVIFAYNAFKKSGDGFMSFGEGFKLSFITIIISTLVGLVWLAVYMFVLEPGYQEVILNAQIEQMEKQGMEGDAMEMAMSWTEKMTSPLFMTLWTIVGAAFMGAIISLLMAAFLQKKRPIGVGEGIIDN